MTLKESIDIREKLAKKDTLSLSNEMVQGIQDSVSDPTGLQPFMKKRIKQSDDLEQRVDSIQVALQEQIDAARKETADAKRQADFSRIIAILSLIAAVASLVLK